MSMDVTITGSHHRPRLGTFEACGVRVWYSLGAAKALDLNPAGGTKWQEYVWVAPSLFLQVSLLLDYPG